VQVNLDASRAAINAWAFEGERVTHGTPSGLDNTMSLYGGFLIFKRAADGSPTFEMLPQYCATSVLPSRNVASALSIRLSGVTLLVTNTKQPRSTAALVGGVRARWTERPSIYEHIFNAIDDISLEVIKRIRELHVAQSVASDGEAKTSASGVATEALAVPAELEAAQTTFSSSLAVCGLPNVHS